MRVPTEESRVAATGRAAYLLAAGCPENRNDAARMQELLVRSGWHIVAEPERADLIICVSCALTGRQEEFSVRTIQALQARKRAGAELIVCGCLPKINPVRLAEIYDGPSFGSDAIERLQELVGAGPSSAEVVANYLLPRTALLSPLERARLSYEISGPRFLVGALLERLYARRMNAATTVFRENAYCIKVSTGCTHACTYCAVRLSRGRIRSKPIEAVAREFDRGLAEGHRAFALIGTDLGSYGRDLGTDLIRLLDELLRRPGDYRLRLRNVHPSFVIGSLPTFGALLESGKISFLSTAVQSGNDRILRLMGRGYRAGQVRDAMLFLRETFPKIELRTQVLVGFPSETDAEFEGTVRFIDTTPFHYTEVYTFDPRPGTRAARMPHQVPRAVAARRCSHIHIRALVNGLRTRRRGPLVPVPGNEGPADTLGTRRPLSDRWKTPTGTG